jgi:hypothetical protein
LIAIADFIHDRNFGRNDDSSLGKMKAKMKEKAALIDKNNNLYSKIKLNNLMNVKNS